MFWTNLTNQSGFEAIRIESQWLVCDSDDYQRLICTTEMSSNPFPSDKNHTETRCQYRHKWMSSRTREFLTLFNGIRKEAVRELHWRISDQRGLGQSGEVYFRQKNWMRRAMRLLWIYGLYKVMIDDIKRIDIIC